MTFEQRQGSSGVCAVAAVYGATLPLAQRHPLHMLFMVVAACMFLGNLHHATGKPFLVGCNPMITPAGRGLDIVFVPFWIAIFVLNYMGFQDSKAAIGKSN
ncbi:expressed unknown protein [Seminavis robusta]|uniref:Uncharacterized protein n=1 Tax=Seminavis robusta TaxID=568900 RepID=A0A9N8DP25_9STRA|nr:expressed unknown protein [Seminavis robusta]|eukprot:Sro187_g080840.1 n/a (101) ;mRNA; r:16898-17200